MAPPTDRERVAQAFYALRILGWLAEGPMPCCGSCSASEALGRIEADPERWDRGYVFFHDQDEASAFGEDGLLVGTLGLSFGVALAEDGDQSAVAAGVAEICRRLWEAGLRAGWNGRPDTRILVEPYDVRDRYLQLLDAGVPPDEARRMTYDREEDPA